MVTDTIVITGGRTLNETLSSVITIGKVSSLPDLAEGVFGHNLIALETGKIMQIGSTGDWLIDYLDANSSWIQGSLWADFNELSYFSSVNLERSSPWHIDDNNVLKLGPSGSVERYSIPFKALHGHCTVDNGRHVVIIGAGEERNEIWAGSAESLGTMQGFLLMNVLPFGRRDHKCLWIGTEIFVTGGNIGTPEFPSFVDNVDIIDTLNGRVKSGGNLLTRRANHGIIIWNRKPTVIGGQIMGNGSSFPALASKDEYFDSDSRTWRVLPESFGLNRHSFGLVQFVAVKNRPLNVHGFDYSYY